MDIFNLPISGFGNLAELIEQTNKLHNIINNNPDYFGNFLEGYSTSQFLSDYDLYKRTEKDRNQQLMKQAELSLHEYVNLYDESLNNTKFQELLSAYNQRIDMIKSLW